nr:superoxide dismutase [Ni] [Prolixibacteraceae bacterium]
MKTKLLFVLLLGTGMLFSNKSNAHCEIPCGIYGDSTRIELIREHIKTIEKSMNQISLLSTEKDINQLVRWVNNKESHEEKFQDIVSQYFLHQRIKLTESSNIESYTKYTIQLVLLHKLVVYSMKAKQTTDLKYVKLLNETLKEFSDVYF